MGMRKYERAVVKYRLESLGYTNLNRKRSDKDGKPVPSGFAQTWRKILTPGTQHNREWMKYWRKLHGNYFLKSLPNKEGVS